MKPGRRIPPHGELRRSQILTTFGPGAMLDLPLHSVLIGGLEGWKGDKERVYEARLEGWLSDKLKTKELQLYAPPIPSSEPQAPKSGIDVYQFPIWFLGQVEETWQDARGQVYRTRPLLPWNRLVKGGYLTRDRKIKPVVPVRFVQACVRGHISDIDWYGFVRHDYQTERTGDLWMDEGGAGNDLSEIYVRDEKMGNQRRRLSEAADERAKPLGNCRGRSPWLGPSVRGPCDRPSRLLTRSASNAYFAQTVSVISLPDHDHALRTAVERVYEDFLKYCETAADIPRERKKDKVKVALEGFADAAVWADVQRRQAGAAPLEKSIKQTELETLLMQKDTIGDDQPEGNFYARRHPLGLLPRQVAGKLDRLVLVHRLREVSAQLGFTRFEPIMPDIYGELDLEVERAPLSRELSWLPATEHRGEGVFLSFSKEAIAAWLQREAVKRRGEQLLAGFDKWKSRHRQGRQEFPSVPYIMLHSLSHLLITALSLDCGYSASALRERVYSLSAGYGILLYTGTSGSEGSLGGLVEMGKNVGRLIERALELGRLCSNDPVCGQHDPADPHEERFLHGAACHGCLLIAETSCERRNEYLDRALVVDTVATKGAAFFEELP